MQARGSSIIVPIGNDNSTPASSATSATVVAAMSRIASSSWTAATSGTMISGWGSSPRLRSEAAASAIARTCSEKSPGTTRPRRTPRRPSIGFCSCSRWTSASSVVASLSGAPVASATATWTDSSVKSGRNSCSGGSSSRIVTGTPRVLRRVGVGPDAEPAALVGPRHEPLDGIDDVAVTLGHAFRFVALQGADHGARHHGDLADEHLAGAAVDGDDVALADPHAVRRGELASSSVDTQDLGPDHARATHPARDHGGMAGLSAAGGEDALGGDHAAQVVGVRLPTDQDDVLAAVCPLDGARRAEHGLADGRAGTGGHALGHELTLSTRVELREHQPGELVAGDPGQRLVLVDQSLVDELAGDPERRRGRALADAGLEHPQLAALDG